MAFWKAEKTSIRDGHQWFRVYEKEVALDLDGNEVEVQGSQHEFTMARVDERIAHQAQVRGTAENERLRLMQLKAALEALP